jgi:hypothetical protein
MDYGVNCLPRWCTWRTRVCHPVIGRWRCGEVMWTPSYSKRRRCGSDFDIRLPKVGYSYGMSHASALTE